MKTYAVVGLGYVGLGLAVAMGKLHDVLGYDTNEERINELKKQIDRNQLVTDKELSQAKIFYTSRIEEIQKANFYFVTVSTPAHHYEIPDLEPLIDATTTLASVLKKGDIVVFESTVYPGATETLCIPILEKLSHLRHGHDFHVGYSPERINPGDTQHTLKTITKVISAHDQQTLNIMQQTYQSICDTVYPVNSIPIAEAIKVLENTQRDVNIALMNEFSKIMHAMNINMHDVIEGAKTKFGFIPYKPGFVGGHCISIDPHYLAFDAKQHGVYPEFILNARKINDGMTQFVIQSMLKLLIQHAIETSKLRIGIFGITYKENVVDIRNSLALKLIKELQDYGFDCLIHDPLVQHFKQGIHQMEVEHWDALDHLDVAIIAVGHDYYRHIGLSSIIKKCNPTRIVMDIPNLFIADANACKNLIYWSL